MVTKKDRKRAKMKQIQRSRTKVQILKSCNGPHDEDSRVLGVNWMRKEIEGMKYSQCIIKHQFSTKNGMLQIFNPRLRFIFGIENVQMGEVVELTFQHTSNHLN